MLTAGLVGARREVDAGVAVEEVDGLQVEAHRLPGHDWPVLNAGHMRHPKGVPDDHILILDSAILQVSGTLFNPSLSTECSDMYVRCQDSWSQS